MIDDKGKNIVIIRDPTEEHIYKNMRVIPMYMYDRDKFYESYDYYFSEIEVSLHGNFQDLDEYILKYDLEFDREHSSD